MFSLRKMKSLLGFINKKTSLIKRNNSNFAD